MSALLQKAIRQVAQEVQESIHKIELLSDDNGIETGINTSELRRARDLLGVLAHISGGMSAQRAFGAPGDWGYDTPVGDGVLDLLRGGQGGVASVSIHP